MNKIRTAAVAIGAIGLLGAGFGTAEASLIATKTSSGVINSATQAGYVAVPKTGGTVTSFKYVQAQFTVPSVPSCSVNTDAATQEVFVGGFSVQLRDTCAFGYSLHGVNTCISRDQVFGFTPSPGDTIRLIINATTGQETATNLTRGLTQTITEFGCGAGTSAGVLTTANPGSGSPAQTVLDFTQVGFRQAQVEGNTQSAPQPLGSTAWNVREYALKGPSGRVDVKPEALLTGKFTSAFANDWASPN